MKFNENKNRNIGIDLFRLISMLMVTALHTLGHGGILIGTGECTGNYCVAWLIEIMSYGAVNCFILITGYLCCKSKLKLSSLIILWLQVEVYSVVLTIIIKVFVNKNMGLIEVGSSFFPILRNQYWYFTAYFALFLLMPILNVLIEKLTKSQYVYMLIVLFLMFSVLSTIANFDLFQVYGGYSACWFIVMYLMGAYVRLYGVCEKLTNVRCIVIVMICSGVMFFWKLGIVYFKVGHFENLFLQYVSPFVVVSSICMLVIFCRIQVNNAKVAKLISKFSPLSFGVYLIHDNINVRKYLMKDVFLNYAKSGILLFTIKVVTTIILIFLGCLIIELVRTYIFDVLKIKQNIRKLDERLNNLRTLIEKLCS